MGFERGLEEEEVFSSPATGSPLSVPLDPWDELFYSLYVRYEGAGAIAAVMYLRGRLEPEPLRAALARLQRRHPKLRARIAASSSGRHRYEILEPPPEIPCEVADREGEDLPWREECTRLMSEKLDTESGPLARVLALRSSTEERCVLVLVVHHTVGDGRSLLQLVFDLLELYAAAERGESAPRVESLAIPTAPRAKLRGNPVKRLLMMARWYRHRRRNRKADWAGLPRGEGVPTHRLLTHVVFSEPETTALAQRCREEGVGLTGALFAAGSLGMAAALQQPDLRLKCRFPIDVRSMLASESGPVTEKDLGNYISGYETIYRVEDGAGFWPLARYAHREIKRFADVGGPSVFFNAIRSVKLPYRPQTLRRGTMLVSSLGVVRVPEPGSLQLDGLAVELRNESVGPSAHVLGLVLHGRLNLSLSMVEVPEEFWGRVRDEIQRRLEEAMAEVRGPPDGRAGGGPPRLGNELSDRTA